MICTYSTLGESDRFLIITFLMFVNLLHARRNTNFLIHLMQNPLNPLVVFFVILIYIFITCSSNNGGNSILATFLLHSEFVSNIERRLGIIKRFFYTMLWAFIMLWDFT